MYRAELLRNHTYDGRDFVDRLNEVFDEGWQYVEYLEVGNANGGYTPVMILKKED